MKGHEWSIKPRKTYTTINNGFYAKDYVINLLVVLACHQMGLGVKCLEKFFAYLGIKSLHQHAFRSCEDHCGKSLISVAEETMKDAQKEEKKLSEEKFGRTFINTVRKIITCIIIAVDMGWNKRSSGKRYDSPSGVCHMVGVLSEKHIWFHFNNKNLLLL